MSLAERNQTAVDHAAAALREWIGLDPDTIGRSAVERAVRQACRTAPPIDASEFAARLAADPELRDRLVEEAIVAESWFFRDPPVFDFLRRQAAAWAGAPGRGPLRVLCVPCAAGEEPYSVAMAFLDAGLDPGRFTIDAYDVSRAGLRRAGEARYSVNAFRGADLAFRDRWFRPAGAGWELSDAVRAPVRFARGNLLAEDFLPNAAAYDVVMCRNLLIYLSAAARRRVETVLDRLVAAEGVLVLGAAEPPILTGNWVPAATTAMFTLRRGPPAAVSPAPQRTAVAPPPPTVRAEPGPAGQVSAAAAGPVPPRPPAAGTTAAGVADVVAEAGRLANAGLHAEAILLCMRHEAAAGPSADVVFLLAMLHQAAGDAARAEDLLRKTLYLDPAHDEAFLALALAASRRGEAGLAEKYRQAAVRALARKGTP
jgi:chemotaxis protein methyltransferase WspC